MAISGEFRIITNDFQLEKAIEELKAQYASKKYVQVQYTTTKRRSSRQNNAIHLYCKLAADRLNLHGLDQRKVLKPSFEIPWTQESFKENLWKPIMKAMFEIDSTTKLERGQVGQVYEVINRELSREFGVSTEFPDKGGL